MPLSYVIQKESEGGRDVGKVPSVTSQPGPCASQVPGHLLRGGVPSHALRGQVQSIEWRLHPAAPALPSDEGQLTCHQLFLPIVGNQRAQACVWRAVDGELATRGVYRSQANSRFQNQTTVC